MQRTQRPFLARLARANPTSVFLGALVLVLAGFLAPGIIGGALLLALAVGLVALSATTWPVQSPPTRVIRLLLLTMLLAVALLKILG